MKQKNKPTATFTIEGNTMAFTIKGYTYTLTKDNN